MPRTGQPHGDIWSSRPFYNQDSSPRSFELQNAINVSSNLQSKEEIGTEHQDHLVEQMLDKLFTPPQRVKSLPPHTSWNSTSNWIRHGHGSDTLRNELKFGPAEFISRSESIIGDRLCNSVLKSPSPTRFVLLSMGLESFKNLLGQLRVSYDQNMTVLIYNSRIAREYCEYLSG